MFELLNELQAEFEKLFNAVVGYSGQKDKIRDLMLAIETVAKNYIKEE